MPTKILESCKCLHIVSKRSGSNDCSGRDTNLILTWYWRGWRGCRKLGWCRERTKSRRRLNRELQWSIEQLFLLLEVQQEQTRTHIDVKKQETTQKQTDLLTSNQDYDSSSHGNAGLACFVISSTVGAFHSHAGHAQTGQRNDNTDNHKGTSCLESTWWQNKLNTIT